MKQPVAFLCALATLFACDNQRKEFKTSSQAVSGGAVAGAGVAQQETSSSNDNDDSDIAEEVVRREWDPGRMDEGKQHSRFLARAYPGSSRSLLLSLDTSTSQGAFAHIDTLVVTDVRRSDLFTYHCHTVNSDVVGQIGALSSSGTPEHFEHPRLAWRFDTLMKRIQKISADSVFCTVSEPD